MATSKTLMSKLPALLFFFFFFFFVARAISGADDSLATKCAKEFQKVTPCLSFATAKASAPSKDCCGSVTELKNSDPACLCFIIQQVHNGTSDTVKSMGIQETRLLQLPSACHLTNASISECPKLLHLPANSPDAAIFGNSTTAAAGSAPPAGGGGSSAATESSPSAGVWHKPEMTVCMFLAGVAFFLGFPGDRSVVTAA